MNPKMIMSYKLEYHINKLMREKGIPKDRVKEIKTELRDYPRVEGEDYYYYNGPLDEKTRPFCKQMLTYDKVVSSTDIDILSNYLNYDVKKYKGSYNCRHQWVKFRGKVRPGPDLTVNQIRNLVRKGIQG